MAAISPDDLQALASGQGFVDLASWRKVSVSGEEAISWLDRLVSADLSDLSPNLARRTLLLSPTGRVRAEFTVAVPGGPVVLLQDPAQPEPVHELLRPYVLSADVVVEDRTDELALLSFPGREDAPDAPGAARSAPSCVGRGSDLISPTEDRRSLLGSLEERFRRVDDDVLQAWRVLAGIPRVGVDVGPEDLPPEAALDEAVSYDKGCFLGQEAVAKLRNLGHPRRVLVALESEAAVAVGDPVLVDGGGGATGAEVGADVAVDGARAGRVTSAADVAGRIVVLASIRWVARDGPFRTERGARLRPR